MPKNETAWSLKSKWQKVHRRNIWKLLVEMKGRLGTKLRKVFSQNNWKFEHGLSLSILWGNIDDVRWNETEEQEKLGSCLTEEIGESSNELKRSEIWKEYSIGFKRGVFFHDIASLFVLVLLSKKMLL